VSKDGKNEMVPFGKKNTCRIKFLQVFFCGLLTIGNGINVEKYIHKKG